jgi:hypothetical protein
MIPSNTILEKAKFDPRWIVLKTASNGKAAEILFFFATQLSEAGRSIMIEYESCEQVPSICRMLVDADIDIFEIYLMY